MNPVYTLDTTVSTAVPGIIMERLVVEMRGSVASLTAFGLADRTTFHQPFSASPLILVTMHRNTVPTPTMSVKVGGCYKECKDSDEMKFL